MISLVWLVLSYSASQQVSRQRSKTEGRVRVKYAHAEEEEDCEDHLTFWEALCFCCRNVETLHGCTLVPMSEYGVMTAWINAEVIVVKEVLELASVRVSECLSDEKKNSSRVRYARLMRHCTEEYLCAVVCSPLDSICFWQGYSCDLSRGERRVLSRNHFMVSG